MAKAKYDYPVSRGAEPRWRHAVTTASGASLVLGGTTEEARAELLALGDRPTEVELGGWGQRWYRSPFLVDGCGAGMLILHFMGLSQSAAVRIGIGHGECCGFDPRRNGMCQLAPELVCPNVRQAGKIVRQESCE